MNILIINLDKGIFSPNSKSLERLKEYSRRVEKIFVIVWTLKKEQPIVFENRLFVYPTNSISRWCYFFDSFRIFKKKLTKEKIDLIFTQDPFETGLTGWLLASAKKIPLQIQVHTDYLSPYFSKESCFNRVRVALANFLLPRARTIRVVSERIKKSIITKLHLTKEKIFVLPIYVDVQEIKNDPIIVNLHQKYLQFNKIILVASRLSKEKNIRLAIAVMVDIIKQFPQTGLIVVGSGGGRSDLEKMTYNLSLQNYIKFEPWTDELSSYFKTADVFLLTSNYEGYGLTAVEALAAECPLIMTNVGCAGELVRDGYNGFVVPVNEKDKLKFAIINLLTNQSLRNQFKEKGLESVAKLNNLETYLNKYLQTWKETAL